MYDEFPKEKKKKNRIFYAGDDALPLVCTPVSYLPLLFQGVSASGLPTNRYP